MRVSLSLKTLAILACSSVAMASYGEESSPVIYESLDDIEVGRLFFSPQDRERLDQLRSGVRNAPRALSATVAKKRSSETAAGFITSSKGKSQIYLDGEFRSGKPSSEVRFPGKVKVVRGSTGTDAKKEE